MREYAFLFETASKVWVEKVKATSMYDAAKKAKVVAQQKAKALGTLIQYSFYVQSSMKPAFS